MTSRYWEEREQANKRRYNRADKEAQKEVREIHKRMQDEIQKDIDAFFGKYAAEEGITLVEAKRRVSKLDIEAFERKAKKYVEDRDFSEQANAEMKLYNLTMKVNRLELLKAEIGLEMIKAHDEINGLTDRVLLERAEEEYRRQAGILGDTVQDIAGRARKLADASFHNATWKDRAWTNHAELKANLDVLLQRGLIRGDNPRQLARSLHKALNVDLNKCERLMVTELARVQTDASIDSFVRNGFERYQYITCGYGDACKDCKALSDKVFKIKDMKVGENAPPLHPWCHCSIAPYEDSEEYERWLKELDSDVSDTNMSFESLLRSVKDFFDSGSNKYLNIDHIKELENEEYRIGNILKSDKHPLLDGAAIFLEKQSLVRILDKHGSEFNFKEFALIKSAIASPDCIALNDKHHEDSLLLYKAIPGKSKSIMECVFIRRDEKYVIHYHKINIRKIRKLKKEGKIIDINPKSIII